MDIQTVDNIKMEALKSLAETNLQVSAVKETLSNLKDEESVYIEKREKKVLAQIEEMVTESREILAEAYQNYNTIHDLSKNSEEFSFFLTETYQDFQKLKETFEASTEAWEDNVKETQKGFEQIKNQIKVDKVQIKNDKEAVEKAQKALGVERRKIRDERETLERAIKRLKENKI